MPCEACEGRGFLLIDRDHSGHLEIQRCDACDKYQDDNKATEACFRFACAGMEVQRFLHQPSMETHLRCLACERVITDPFTHVCGKEGE